MYRTLATANAFADSGWDVTVLTATRETFDVLTGMDTNAERQIDPRITVVRVPFDLERGETDLARWPGFRARLPLWWSLITSFRERAKFPETVYGGWYSSLVAAARQVHAQKPVSLVIGSANPNVDFAPGADLHRRHGVPYVMDYRDAWHLNVYSGKAVGSRWSRSARIERKLLRGATEAWFVNRPIRDWHAERYAVEPGKLHVVANGFDKEFLDQRSARTRRASDQLVFGYLGTIYGPMPLRESLEGWALARTRSELLSKARLIIRGHLGHYSTPDSAVRATIEQFADDAVSYEGPVSKTEVASVYNGFDALLLALSSSRFITSGKVFEYAATGLPITSVHATDSAASTLLKDHPAWHPTETMNADSIADAFVSTAEQAARYTEADVSDAREWASQFSREQQLQPRIDALRKRLS